MKHLNVLIIVLSVICLFAGCSDSSSGRNGDVEEVLQAHSDFYTAVNVIFYSSSPITGVVMTGDEYTGSMALTDVSVSGMTLNGSVAWSTVGDVTTMVYTGLTDGTVTMNGGYDMDFSSDAVITGTVTFTGTVISTVVLNFTVGDSSVTGTITCDGTEYSAADFEDLLALE